MNIEPSAWFIRYGAGLRSPIFWTLAEAERAMKLLHGVIVPLYEL